MNGFSTQNDPEMRGKTISRLEAITTLQKFLEDCLQGRKERISKNWSQNKIFHVFEMKLQHKIKDFQLPGMKQNVVVYMLTSHFKEHEFKKL